MTLRAVAIPIAWLGTLGLNLVVAGQDIRSLDPSAPVESELAGGQAHQYQLTLSAGQFLLAAVTPKGIDVEVRVFQPDGGKIAESDNADLTRTVRLVSPSPGVYRLEVRATREKAAPGRYQVKIVELRPSTQADRDHIRDGAAAARVFLEAEQLRAQRTPDSMRRAIAKYEEAVPLWESAADPTREAMTLNNLGRAYKDSNDIPHALATYEHALAICRAIGNHLGEGMLAANIGSIHMNRSDPEKTLDYYAQALKAFQDAGYPAGEAEARKSAGIVYSGLGQNQKAMEFFEEALRASRRAGDAGAEAGILTAMGHQYIVVGESAKAIEILKQGLALCRQIQDRGREASTLNMLGVAYDSIGESAQSLEMYRSTLQLAKAAGERGAEMYASHNIGVLYGSLGETQKGLDTLEQSLQLSRSVGDRRSEATILHDMGKMYAQRGEQGKALEFYAQALPGSQAVGDRRQAAQTLDATGLALLHTGEPQKAMEAFGQALTLARDTQDPGGEALTLQHLGFAYEGTDSQRAIEYFNQSLKLATAVGDRSVEAVTLYHLARVQRDRGDLAQSRNLAANARGIIESARTKVGTQGLRSSYFALVQDYYGLEADVLMALHATDPSRNYQAEAFAISERARARTLLETLGEAGADIREGVDPSLLERERGLQVQLNARELARTQTLASRHTPEQAAEFEKALSDLTAQYDEVRGQIRARSPHYAELEFPQPLTLDEIQKEVLDPDTLLLEYELGEPRSFLWVVSSTGMSSVVLPKRSALEQAARSFYEALTGSGNPAQTEAGKVLSHMLFGEAASRLGGKRLLIVADGALQYLPFAAVPDPADDRRPLVVHHEIVNAPSASTLAALRRENSSRKPAPKVLAVLADPVFSPDDSRINRSPNQPEVAGTRDADQPLDRSVNDVGLAGPRLARLPGTRREAAGIVSLLPETERRQALDFDASRATLMSQDLGQYRILHLATHGLLNSAHPELSGIVLSLVDRQGQPQDGFMRLHEIYNLKLSADLVVLSACQTGLGKDIRGEGLVGLTRGFMYAGAPRVVASLWKVDDRATAELMKQFYSAMLGKDALRPAAALRAAQIQMSKTKGFEDPYYWAAFTLQGEWR